MESSFTKHFSECNAQVFRGEEGEKERLPCSPKSSKPVRQSFAWKAIRISPAKVVTCNFFSFIMQQVGRGKTGGRKGRSHSFWSVGNGAAALEESMMKL